MATPSTKSKKTKLTKSWKLKHIAFLLFPLIIVAVIAISFCVYFSDKIYPGIKVGGVKLEFLTKEKAIQTLEENTKSTDKIKLYAKDKEFDLDLTGIGFSYNIEKSVDEAFLVHRSGSWYKNIKDSIFSFTTEKNIGLKINLNTEKLQEYLQVISGEVASEPVLPSVKLEGKNIKIDTGKPGENANTEEFKSELIKKLSSNNFEPITLNFTPDDSSLTEEEADELYNRATKLTGKTISLENEFDVFNLKEKETFSFLDGNGKYYDEVLDTYINTQIEPKVNREPQNASFKFENGKVLEFKPAKNGLTINKTLLKNQILMELSSLESSDTKSVTIKVPVETRLPEITTDKVNDLGIKELLGRGTSKFAGSIPSRMHNISHATSKFNGVLVPPNAEFSFNETLGDVSSLTGYKQAYVIRDGKTVLGDGGGVCQVSSTLFRALLNAGLPITERRAHSYRVGYYEQESSPGLDATVFAPTTDLKFKNDTSGHLLIQTQYDGKNASLVFEIYGTSDGRVVTTTKPVMLSQTKPPDDLYIDDPTLPTGQVKQIEHKAWGAKVSFDHKVERNGEIIFQKTFLSAYRPWGAVFMRGTGPAI